MQIVETICMKCKNLFSQGKKRKIFQSPLLKILAGVLSVNEKLTEGTTNLNLFFHYCAQFVVIIYLYFKPFF